jgi:hypothetical protein
MAEINAGFVKTLQDALEEHGRQIEVIKGDIGEIGDVSIGEILEQYGEYIVRADRKLPDLEARVVALEERKAAGQPDWFLNTKPEEAAAWLDAIGVYTDRVVRYVIKDQAKLKLTACWPWHPRAVAELLASMCHYRAAHRGGIPTPVADLWRQWLDGTVDRVNGLLSDCAFHHKAELVDTSTGQISREWTVDQAQLPAYLTWWCTSDREGIPPGLRRKT